MLCEENFITCFDMIVFLIVQFHSYLYNFYIDLYITSRIINLCVFCMKTKSISTLVLIININTINL